MSQQQKWLERPDHQILLNIECEYYVVVADLRNEIDIFSFLANERLSQLCTQLKGGDP